MSLVTGHHPRRPASVPALSLLLVLGLVAALPAAAAAQQPGGVPEPVGVWPLRPIPEVAAAFDPPSSAWGAGHRGVDLVGAPGQAVRSSLAGVVSFAGTLAGRGVVVVDHGDTRTTYEPVAAEVAVGDAVAAGGRIGVLQLAGSHCFPRACLHWGWLRGTTYLDPLGLVGAGPVRLLPLGRDQPADPRAAPPWRAPALPYAAWQPLSRFLFGV